MTHDETYDELVKKRESLQHEIIVVEKELLKFGDPARVMLDFLNQYTGRRDSGLLITDKVKRGVKKVRYRFTPPTTKQVMDYAETKGINIDAEDFCEFYISKGWMVGSNKMKCWKSAASRWARKNAKEVKENGNSKFSAGEFIANQAKECFEQGSGDENIRDIN